MNILILTQKIDINDDVLGFFHGWVRAFSERFDFVTVICLEKREYDLPENVKVLSLGKEDGSSRLQYIIRFYRYIWHERKNYDAVFVHMNQEYVLLGGLLWRLWGKRISLWYTHKKVSMTLRVAEMVTHIVFTASKESFRLKSRKLHIVGHGIDASAYNSEHVFARDVLRIVTVGRISPVKDFETLLRALAELQVRGLEYEFTVYGRPGTAEQQVYYEEIKTMVQDLSLTSVLFKGSLPNTKLPQELQSYDVFVNASNTGSLDKAVLEAMASGLVVLTSNVGVKSTLESAGLADTLMFPPRDSVKLADKLVAVSHMTETKKQEISNALSKEVAEHHNMTNLIRLLSSVLSAG